MLTAFYDQAGQVPKRRDMIILKSTLMLRQQWILKCENNNYQKLADKNISFKSREKTNSIIVTHIKGKMVSSLINMHIAQQHLVCNSLSATPDLENGVKFMNCRVALP